ncbi:hypothetical protein FOL47_001956 [Perkinsus chesapeaki]|uniref:Uncharacterized protein n=1 Tax=Perkinsus chesapeaki TaxID=330153 RepID=A0A7J6N1S9_PERCH|nr:hypothetical protein FOL47_001956 [Perkinsus chesapeaki]
MEHKKQIRSLQVQEEAKEQCLKQLEVEIAKKEMQAIRRQERMALERSIINRVGQEGWCGRHQKALQRTNSLEADFRLRVGDGLSRKDRTAENLVQLRSARWAALVGRDIPKHVSALKARQEREAALESTSIDHFARQLAAEESALRRQERQAKERHLFQTLHGIEWTEKHTKFNRSRERIDEDYKARAAEDLSLKDARHQRLLKHRRALSDLLAEEANYLSREVNRLVRRQASTKCTC